VRNKRKRWEGEGYRERSEISERSGRVRGYRERCEMSERGGRGEGNRENREKCEKGEKGLFGFWGEG